MKTSTDDCTTGSSPSLKDLINTAELPSLPDAVVKFNELVGKEAHIVEIADLIRHDPGLAARTLELANNAWYKRQREISTLTKPSP